MRTESGGHQRQALRLGGAIGTRHLLGARSSFLPAGAPEPSGVQPGTCKEAGISHMLIGVPKATPTAT